MRYLTIILSFILINLCCEASANSSDFKIKINTKSSTAVKDSTDISIPVIIYYSSAANFTDAQITSTLEKINDVLSNSGSCNEISIPSSNNIQFCLATRDIDKNPSEGILSLGNQFASFDSCEDEFDMKFSPRMMSDLYPTSEYINIYLVDDICASCENFGCAAGGYSTLPSSHGTIMDGIILELDTWLGDCDDTKTIIHEIGHYFGLYHTFEGGCKNDNCLEDGDKVCDTPPQFLEMITNDHICLQGSNNNSCSTDVNFADPNNLFVTDQEDLDNNIMNYIPLSCQKSLTSGQVERMKSTLCNERATLLDSEGCQEPCLQKIDISLIIPGDAYVNQLFEIDNVTGDSNTYLWEVDEQQVNTIDLAFTFDEEGQYFITLFASNGEDGCDETFTFMVNVECFEQPIIVADSLIINEIDTINLSIQNVNPELNYTWYAGDSIIGTGTSIVYFSNFAGAFNIYISACINTCCMNSNILHFLGGDCTPDNEGDLWIFGRDGIVLNFETGSPIEEPNLFQGDFANDFNSDEPSTIQLDQNEDLLFYSNADKVWNKNHEVMFNGNLEGSRSACQSLSIRRPGFPNLYYLFTPEQNFRGSTLPNEMSIDSARTIYYSVIDMNMNNGLGDVTIKDQKLLDFGPEKISAVRHCNGQDWWIVTHPSGSSEFHSFLLSNEGLSLNPIVSQIGGFQPFQAGKIGFIKFSHDGKLLAHTYRRTPDSESNEDSYGNLELFTFDNSIGTARDIVFQDSSYTFPYGIEFSPDNSKLYVTELRVDSTNNYLNQYDLSKLNQTDIINSKYPFVSPTNMNRFTAIQLGKDNKVYMTYLNAVSGSPFALHVIHDPNESGDLANLAYMDFPLQYGEGFVGLPNFPARVYRQEYPEIEGSDSLNICTDSILTYYSFGRCSVEEYSWELIGENTLLQTTGDTIQIAFHTKSIDTLLLTRTTACGEYTDTLSILIDDCNFECNLVFDWIEIDTLICEGESPALHYSATTHDLYVNNILQNKNNTRIDIGPIATDTCLAFHLIDNYECDSSFQICITVGAPLTYTFEDEISVCEGNTAIIDLVTDADIVELINIENDSILFLDVGSLFTEPIFESTSYLLRLARYDGNCDSYFPILVFPDTLIYEENMDTLFCLGDSLIVNDSLIFSEGIYEFKLTTIKSCDSLLIVDAQYFILPDSDTSYLLVCTTNEIDTIYFDNVSSDGCIYQDVQIFSLVDLDTTFVQDISCNAQSLQNDTLSFTNLVGCDSFVIVEYTYEFDSVYYEHIDTSICPESEIMVGDSVLMESGSYTVYTLSQDGCDSIVTIILDNFELPIQDTIYTYTCLESQIDSNYIRLFTIDGCSYDDVFITIYEALDTSYTTNIVCNGDLNLFDTINLTSIEGCDSIVIIQNEYVFDSSLYLQYLDTLTCPDEQFTFNDSLIAQEGSYHFDLIAQDGCDSIISLDVSYYNLPDIDTSYTITCISSEVDTIEIFNTTAEGCSYFDLTIITYEPSDTGFVSEYLCNDISEYNDTLTLINSVGCDSFTIISYTFELDSTKYFQAIDTFLCPDDMLTIGDSTVANSGYYEFKLISADGCDFIVAVNLEYFSIPSGDTSYNYTCNILEVDTNSVIKTSVNGCQYSDILITYFVNPDTTFLQEIECMDSIRIDTSYLLNEFNCDSIVITEFVFEDLAFNIELNNPYPPNENSELFIDSVTIGVTYDWYLDGDLVCGDCLSYSYTPSEDQELSVVASNEFGCAYIFSSPIEVQKTTKVSFANVFSPNGDQINDRFMPIGFLDEGVSMSDFKIFDRWGNMVHFEKDININDETYGWNGTFNGTICVEGVYVYQVTISYENSSSKTLMGDIALIR